MAKFATNEAGQEALSLGLFSKAGRGDVKATEHNPCHVLEIGLHPTRCGTSQETLINRSSYIIKCFRRRRTIRNREGLSSDEKITPELADAVYRIRISPLRPKIIPRC